MNDTEHSARRFAGYAVAFSLVLAILLVAAVLGYVSARPTLLSILSRNAAFEGRYSDAETYLHTLEELDRERFYEETLSLASIADYRSDWDTATALLENELHAGGSDAAYAAFAPKAEELLKQCRYHSALQLYQQQEYTKASRLAASIADYEPAESLYQLSYQAYLNSLPTPELTSLPTPAPTAEPAPAVTHVSAQAESLPSPTPEPQPTQIPFANLVGEANVATGYHHTVFLRPDGTVLAYGDNSCGQTDVGEWRNIVAVAAGAYHTVGLTKDGRVLATGDNAHGQTDVSLYTDVKQIAAGAWNTCLLLRNGQVITLGFQAYEYAAELPAADAVFAGSYGMIVRCGANNHASHPGIAIDDACVSASVSRGYAIGLDDSGIVHTAGVQLPQWENIVQVSAGENAALALTEGGEVLSHVFGTHVRCGFDFGQPVAAISAGANHYAFILKDGTMEIRHADGSVVKPEETLW